MSKRIPTVTRQLIESAVLPVQTKSYTVISHSDVIKITEQSLEEMGFEIIQDRYKCTKSAQVAQGVYYLNYGKDPEMKMMFAWSNSYDKSLRFRCAIGGSLENGSTILSGANTGSWARKHSGATALSETLSTIKNQMTNAGVYYEKLVQDKEFMQTIPLDLKHQSSLAGRIFIEQDLITSEQVSDMKYWISQSPTNNVWNFYTYLVTVLQKSHPAKWMDCQIAAHMWICNEFDIPNIPVVIPQPVAEVSQPEVVSEVHQVTLEESIAEIAEKTGVPETIQTGFQSMTEPVVIERDPENAPLITVEFGTIDVSEKKVKPKAEDLIAEINKQASEVAEEFGKSSNEEVAPDPITLNTNPDENHLFSINNAEDVLCNICGKDIMDPIHDSF